MQISLSEIEWVLAYFFEFESNDIHWMPSFLKVRQIIEMDATLSADANMNSKAVEWMHNTSFAYDGALRLCLKTC